MPDTRSPIQRWSDERAARLVSTLGAADQWRTEQLPFTGPDDATGQLTLHAGPCTVVDVRLALPALGIDSSMLHAFAPSGTSSPHLLSDLAVLADGTWHFHVDLMPRIDAVTDPSSLEAQTPLTPWAERAMALPGARPIAIPRRLRALSSAWLVGVIVGAAEADDLTAIHDAYVDRFAALLAAPLPTSMSPAALTSRDRAHRAALFDDATDPVWSFLAEHVGAEPVDRILALITGAVDPAAD